MKVILIIEPEIPELEALMDICRLGPDKLTVISARDERSAVETLSQKRVDLILCSTRFPDTLDCLTITRLARSYPYIPIIAIAPKDSVVPDRVRDLGAAVLFEKPLEARELLAELTELVEQSSTGTVRDIPIHSFLQMLESEEKTCSLQVFAGDINGFIYIDDGVLIDAETGTLRGEEAVFEIISWDSTIIEIKYFHGRRERNINKPLISLIMEGFRLKDEREEQKKREQAIPKPKQNLKQIATAGHRLALDIGLRLKLEFEAIDTPLASSLIGLIPESCIIVSTPSHFIVSRSEVPPDSVIQVKFVYLGKLCLFRSRLLNSVSKPRQMLFLEYPAIIHYHEMRKAKRTPIHIPCTLNPSADSHYFGTFIDLSELGGLCLIKTSGNRGLPSLEVGQNLQVNCLLPGLAEEQQLAATVRNFRTNGREMRAGLEFSKLGTTLKKTVRDYLYNFDSEVSFDLSENV